MQFAKQLKEIPISFSETVQIVKEKVKMKPSQILRQVKCRQIEVHLTDWNGGYCAIGALAKSTGITDREVAMYGYDIVAKKMLQGTDVKTADIFRMNDDGKSFLEIADWLESKGL